MTVQADPAIRIEKDVVFGRGGDVELRLDIYFPPAGASKRTAVLQLHGGAFRAGAKENIAANCRALAQRGYTAIASQYRLIDVGHWPAPIEDVKAAIRWIHANVEMLDVEDDRVVVGGYSAGATLSLIAAGGYEPDLEGSGGNAGASSNVSACLAFYPPDVTAEGHHLMAPGAGADARRQASPITYARRGAAPTLLFHATGDTNLPFEGSVNLFNAFRSAGVPVELHLFDGLSHVFDRHPEFAAPAIEICDLFLDRHVVAPRVYPPFTPGASRPG
jgi:acetyl esterase/lipase